MNIDTIIAHIRANCPAFDQRVAGAADMEAAIDEAWLDMPAAYVIPTGATAADNESANGLYQQVTETFSVIVALDNRADRRGQTASKATVDSVRYDLMRALLNWRLDPVRSARGVHFEGERLEKMDRSKLVYTYEWSNQITLTDSDGYQPPSEAWNVTDYIITNANSTLPVTVAPTLAVARVQITPGTIAP